jgi:hypothetical protein
MLSLFQGEQKRKSKNYEKKFLVISAWFAFGFPRFAGQICFSETLPIPASKIQI